MSIAYVLLCRCCSTDRYGSCLLDHALGICDKRMKCCCLSSIAIAAREKLKEKFWLIINKIGQPSFKCLLNKIKNVKPLWLLFTIVTSQINKPWFSHLAVLLCSTSFVFIYLIVVFNRQIMK